MIDNYDSFTYNLVQYFGELGQEVKTFRNDQITIEEIKKYYDRLKKLLTEGIMLFSGQMM